MRSIRRSLLGYLLLLLALGLGGVGLLVDRFAQSAITGREDAETKRVEQTFATRRQEVRAQLDAELVVEAKSLTREVQRALNRVFGQGRGPVGPPRPGDLPRPAPTVPTSPDLSPLKAPNDEANEYRRRVTMLLNLPGPGPWPAIGAGSMLAAYQSPAWSAFESPRAAVRLQFQEILRNLFAEEEHPGYFQFTVVVHFPNHPAQAIAVFHPARVGQDWPLDLEAFQRPNVEYLHDDVEIPDKSKFRRVIIPGGRQYYFWLPPQAPVNIYPPSPFGGPGAFRGFRSADFSISVVVHHARPYSELDSRLQDAQKSSEEELAQMREQTRHQLAQLRTRLGLIGLGSFAALALGGWFIVARGLAPIRKLSDAVSRVSEKDFHLPVERDELSHELVPILARLTQTFDLLHKAFAREKQAVGDISHELRTPIASLLATIDVSLRKPRTSDQYRTTLEDCRGIARQLGQLVERIMTLASLDAGNARNAIVRVEAADLAVSCATIIRPLAEAHGLSFKLNADGPLELDTDPDKLREVLMNLLHNAVEYNRTGGRVELSARRIHDTISFEISDTGIGMTPDVREKIFERFYRADASRHATGVHAGLGLAIVKEYLERLGGTIMVESTPDVGSTFCVVLPAAPSELPSESDDLAPPSESARSALRLRSEAAPTAS